MTGWTSCRLDELLGPEADGGWSGDRGHRHLKVARSARRRTVSPTEPQGRESMVTVIVALVANGCWPPPRSRPPSSPASASMAAEALATGGRLERGVADRRAGRQAAA